VLQFAVGEHVAGGELADDAALVQKVGMVGDRRREPEVLLHEHDGAPR
jgi:hypothetical protein